jgi:hypothetical protein
MVVGCSLGGGGLAELTRKFMRGLVLCLRRQIFDVVKDIDFHPLWVISAIFVSVCLPRKEILKVEAWGTLS